MNDRDDSLAEAKRRLPIPELWRRLGLPGVPAHSCRSPFREDRRPSFSVSTDGQHWRDFGTGEHGDGVDFLARARGLAVPAAIAEFRQLTGVPLPPAHLPATPPTPRPTLRPGSEVELQQLAALRNLGLDGLRLATDRGLLRFGLHHGRPSWFVTDPHVANAQARRLDGQPWANEAKALTLAGSRAARPVGARVVADFPVVLFCEGGPDLLAAHHFITVEARELVAAAVAMLGASLAIPAEDLPLFAGKRVRFVVHADNAGRASAHRWARQLAGVAAAVDAVELAGLRRTDNSAVKDLNDITSIHPDDFEAHHALWSLVPFA